MPESVLPEVLPSSGDFGETDPALTGFRAPIRGVIGDQQAALFGQGCFEPGDAKCTYGTGCFLLQNAGSPRPTALPGLLTSLGAGIRGEPIYVLEGGKPTPRTVTTGITDGRLTEITGGGLKEGDEVIVSSAAGAGRNPRQQGGQRGFRIL